MFFKKKQISNIFIMILMITSAPSNAADSQSTSRMSSETARTHANWHEIVDSVAQHPEVLTKDISAILKSIPVACETIRGERELRCSPVQGIANIAVDPGPLGIIDMELRRPANCDQLYEILSKRFGKGKQEKNDKCYARWKLGKLVKKAYVSVMPGVDNRSQIFLQFGIEQGP